MYLFTRMRVCVFVCVCVLRKCRVESGWGLGHFVIIGCAISQWEVHTSVRWTPMRTTSGHGKGVGGVGCGGLIEQTT